MASALFPIRRLEKLKKKKGLLETRKRIVKAVFLWVTGDAITGSAERHSRVK